jgi:uncharacterized membrane protein YedE/YeeE
MKLFKYLIFGILFGIVMTKSEVISWYRIQEMFHFRSIRLFNIIGMAVLTSIIGIALIKKFDIKDFNNNKITFRKKEKLHSRYILGGIIFGLGWALCGTCPASILVNIGYGYYSMIIVFVFALIGTFLFAIFRDDLTKKKL